MQQSIIKFPVQSWLYRYALYYPLNATTDVTRYSNLSHKTLLTPPVTFELRDGVILLILSPHYASPFNLHATQSNKSKSRKVRHVGVVSSKTSIKVWNVYELFTVTLRFLEKSVFIWIPTGQLTFQTFSYQSQPVSISNIVGWGI